VVDVGGAKRRGDLGSLLGGAGREALAQAPPRGVDANLPTGLGVDEPEVADRRQRLLARVPDLDGDDLVTTGQLEQRAAPVARAPQVRDDEDVSSPPRQPRRPDEGLAERRRAGDLALRLAPELEQKAEQPGPALAGGQRARARVSERDEAEPVRAPACQVADCERHAFGDVGLAPLGRPERHRRRRVEQEPAGQGSLGHVEPDVGLTGPRRDVPVDPAYVVARLVRAHLSQLGAEPERGRAMLAREQPFHATANSQVERAQQRLRHRPRPRTGGRAGRRETRHAVASRASSIWGTGTAARTASRTASGLTSSASAW
jgi:hypothetical protein